MTFCDVLGPTFDEVGRAPVEGDCLGVRSSITMSSSVGTVTVGVAGNVPRSVMSLM